MEMQSQELAETGFFSNLLFSALCGVTGALKMSSFIHIVSIDTRTAH